MSILRILQRRIVHQHSKHRAGAAQIASFVTNALQGPRYAPALRVHFGMLPCNGDQAIGGIELYVGGFRSASSISLIIQCTPHANR